MAGDGSPRDEVLDLIVVGGGVMGLFTAYEATRQGRRVAVLERGRVGDPATASYGRTRSYRRDYLDPAYARLADEAIRLWERFEAATGAKVLVRCGCVNVASAAVTPDLDATYARLSSAVLRRLGMSVTSYDTAGARARFPYLRVDVADDDPLGGLVNLPAVAAALRTSLGGAVHEGVDVTGIEGGDGWVRVATAGGPLTARALVVTAGHGTNGVLRLLRGCAFQAPIRRDRPSEARYYLPRPEVRDQFTAPGMPVVAYLDTGIYLHPIVEGLTEAVKIGYYDPPDLPRRVGGVTGIADFVARCVPGLAGAAVSDVTDVDQCDYDLVADDDFVLGPVPGFGNVFVGVGWRGTGFKFAPWVGRVLAELACREGTVYDVARFAPARFARVDITEKEAS